MLVNGRRECRDDAVTAPDVRPVANVGGLISAPAARSSRMPWAGPVTTTEPAPLTPRHTGVPVSATLAANDILDSRRRRGQSVLPLAFGEAGLPVHPRLREELAAASGHGGYGPVGGPPALRGGGARHSAPGGPPAR